MIDPTQEVVPSNATICPSCKATNKPGELICNTCGHSLVKVTTNTQHLINDVPDERDNDIGTKVFLPSSMSLQLRVYGYKDQITVSFGKLRVLTIGRSTPGNPVEIDLTDYGALDAGVSRSHAALSYLEQTLCITDLGSNNGTFLNGRRLEVGKAEALRAFDVINLGTLEVKVYFA